MTTDYFLINHRERVCRGDLRSQGSALASPINLSGIWCASGNDNSIFRQSVCHALTKEHQYHARTKHIDVCFHFIRWIVEDGKL